MFDESENCRVEKSTAAEAMLIKAKCSISFMTRAGTDGTRKKVLKGADFFSFGEVRHWSARWYFVGPREQRGGRCTIGPLRQGEQPRQGAYWTARGDCGCSQRVVTSAQADDGADEVVGECFFLAWCTGPNPTCQCRCFLFLERHDHPGFVVLGGFRPPVPT